jgi:hypothetical protein
MTRLSRTAGPFLALASAVLLVSGCTRDAQPGAFGSSPAPAEISIVNVYENEDAWPSQVAMTGIYATGEGETLQPGYRGVLIRVDAAGSARIDFGRRGKYDVPIDRTDLIERANEVRTGARNKLAPNFALLVGTRLVDGAAQGMRALESVEIKDARAFLCVFADVQAASFPELARQLGAFASRSGLQTLFFPQGAEGVGTAQIRAELQHRGLPVPFSYPRLSESYTRALLRPGSELPYILLVTPEGRILYEAGPGRDQALAELDRAIELRLGA